MTDLVPDLNLERIDQLDRIRRLEFLVQHLDRELAKLMSRVEQMSKPGSTWYLTGGGAQGPF